MGVKILEADIRRDLPKFLSLLNENRTKRAGIERFEWLYLANPRGKARAWFAIDEKTGEEVAFTCALPRLVKVNGDEIICWNCGDFSVKKRYRTLGVALKLRRAAKDAIDRDEVSALYAHPNDRMKVVHDKVGHHCIGTMWRFARPLNLRYMVEGRVSNRLLAGALSFFGNSAMTVYDRIVLKRNQVYDTLHLSVAEFGPEFDDLFREISSTYSIIGDRGSDFLNWRFFKNPLYKVERIEIRRGGKLAGYLLFLINGKVAVFKDMLCAGEDAPHLVSAWLKHSKARGADSASVILMDPNPLISVIKSLGFRERPESSSVYAYAKKTGALLKEWVSGENWYMTVGDRDI